jgi:hypothetical protein
LEGIRDCHSFGIAGYSGSITRLFTNEPHCSSCREDLGHEIATIEAKPGALPWADLFGLFGARIPEESTVFAGQTS